MPPSFFDIAPRGRAGYAKEGERERQRDRYHSIGVGRARDKSRNNPFSSRLERIPVPPMHARNDRAALKIGLAADDDVRQEEFGRTRGRATRECRLSTCDRFSGVRKAVVGGVRGTRLLTGPYSGSLAPFLMN